MSRLSSLLRSAMRRSLNWLGLAPRRRQAEVSYRRLDHWVAGSDHGWAGAGVAARFEAGAHGAHYLEVLPFGPGIAEAPASKEILSGLKRTGLEEGVLLDFGCGNGAVRELLRSTGRTDQWAYVGIDVNPQMVASCRRRFPQDRFEVVPVDDPLPLQDSSVNVVLASGVIEMVDDPSRLLSEWRRVTDKWVMVYRLGTRSDRPSAIYLQSVRHAWGIEEHAFRVFNTSELHAMIAAAGLEIVWREVSPASGQWSPPDDAVPVQHYLYLLRKAPIPSGGVL